MVYNLYIDVLFFINFMMDLLILSILRFILKYKLKVIRLILASSLGAAWACLVIVFPVLPFYLELLLTYGAVSALMVRIAYGIKKWRETVRAVAGLYMTAVIMGGTVYALYQHTRAGYYLEQLIAGKGAAVLPLSVLILLAAGSFFAVRYLWSYVISSGIRRSHLCQVTLCYRGNKKTVTALMDTGNRLYEPVSHRPVSVITYESLKQICEAVSSVVYIPYQSVGKQDGILPGIFLDEMEIRRENQVMTISKPLVAVSRSCLSPSGEYEMLLHEEL